ncbi:glycohydrolase toxin TNT-related protein [Mycetocola saprophilus]|uniref:glycohydrolase toxin TNT-related protein n=1 Tax=Mycetocola saprophilus TaxID=76636 RepID=UPI00138E18ED|nr:glycohydrolase toxin TNT-related protein [Mycetocola saprophilus]
MKDTLVAYRNPRAFIIDHGLYLDRWGTLDGTWFHIWEKHRAPSFGARSLPPTEKNAPYYPLVFTEAAAITMARDGIEAQVSRTTRWFGQRGGAIQAQFWAPDAASGFLTAEEVIQRGYAYVSR